MTDDPNEVVPGPTTPNPEPDPDGRSRARGAVAAGPPNRPGASTFTIEGRASPALFVIGWLASLLGLAIAIGGALGGSGVLALLVGPGLLSLGLIAACGNQAFERRARGDAYAGPSPFLVFGTVVAITFFVAFVVGLLLVATIGDETDVSAPVGELVSGLLTAAIFIGTVRLTGRGNGGALLGGDAGPALRSAGRGRSRLRRRARGPGDLRDGPPRRGPRRPDPGDSRRARCHRPARSAACSCSSWSGRSSRRSRRRSCSAASR
jgi:hypothetical protein